MTSSVLSSRALDPHALLAELTRAECSRAHAELRRWYPDEELARNFRETLEAEVDRIRNEDFARQFHQRCPVPGVTAAEYTPRVLASPVGGVLLAAIRFAQLDVEAAFVAIVGQTVEPHDEAGLKSCVALLAAEFRGFSPRQVRWQQSSDRPFDLRRVPGVEPGKRVVAAPLERLRASPPPLGASRVTLEAVEAEALYSDYVALYDDLYAEKPEVAAWARRESLEDLADYQATGALFRIRVDGIAAGCVAGYRGVEQGVRGVGVGEMVLARTYRGLGLAPAVQWHFAQALLASGVEGGAALYGTIHPDNTPALRAALRVGRIDLGGTLGVSVGDPGALARYR